MKFNRGGAVVTLLMAAALAFAAYYLLLGQPKLNQFLQSEPPSLDVAGDMLDYRDSMRELIARVHVQGVLGDGDPSKGIRLDSGEVVSTAYGYPSAVAHYGQVSLGGLAGIEQDGRFEARLSRFEQCPQVHYVPRGYPADRCHIRYVEACQEGDLPTLVLSQYCD